MITSIKSDKIITGKKILSGYIVINNGVIDGICETEPKADKYYDFTGNYVSCGFIEMHTHGAGGHAFMNSEVDDVIEGCNYHLVRGTTTIVPTVSADAVDSQWKRITKSV